MEMDDAAILWGPLVVLETDAAFIVVREADPDDWIARFDKGTAFPAREWAERMAALYNLRADTEPVKPLFAGSYHPPM